MQYHKIFLSSIVLTLSLFSSRAIASPDPCSPSCSPLTDLGAVIEAEAGASTNGVQAFFAPFDDLEDQVLRALDKAQKEVLVAHYNIRRQAILDKLVELAARGVTVKVAVDATNAVHEWNVGDDLLEANGIKVLRTRPSGASALMHLKACVIDGETVMAGSFNWNSTAALANDENMLLLRDKKVAEIYKGEILEILGEGPKKTHGGKATPNIEVRFSPEENLASILASQIKQATRSIDVAMFTFSERKLQDALVDALKRGVKVRLVTETKQANKLANDEIVEENGGEVIRGANRVGAFSAMHQKYAIIDGQKVITGATNWTKNGTRYSNEDILIVKDQDLAEKYQANFADLMHVYGNVEGGPTRAVAPTLFHAVHSGTSIGDRVFVVGSDPALGSWDPARGIELQTADDLYPAWAGNALLPANTTFEYKFVTLRADGRTEWESGANRVLKTDENGRATVISGDYGDTSRSWTPTQYTEPERPVPTYLQAVDGGYLSPGGLKYGNDKAFGNRALHVLDHLEDSGEKESQGVYTVSEAEIFPLIDECWGKAKGDLDTYIAELQGPRTAYDIPAGRVIGRLGGNSGAGETLSTIRVVIQNGNEVVSAFPVKP